LGGVLTLTGVGTLAAGKQVLEDNGKRFLVDSALKANFALITARRADYFGNLEYARADFNALMALVGTVAIVEAEDLVQVGTLAPNAVVTRGVLVTCTIAKNRAAAIA
jgi:acetate CoA/acetoacetate CoA-transferase alpha subunit